MARRGVCIYASATTEHAEELQRLGFRFCKKDGRWERNKRLCQKKNERATVEKLLPEGVRIEESE